MALGRRKKERQLELWAASRDMARAPRHIFYGRLNQLLGEAGFDAFIESLCEPYYASGLGRPGIPPGVYFRMLFIGYFEGIDSQRGIAWRCGDSLSLREFLGISPTEQTPDHSSLSPPSIQGIELRQPDRVCGWRRQLALPMRRLSLLMPAYEPL